MTLPHGFLFSQSSLQDFEDCRRRFQLRYLQHLAWPAVETEPALEHERWMRQGQRFHHMVQQHLSGVPLEQLSSQALDPDLSQWWDHYQLAIQDPASLGRLWQSEAQRYPEVSLSAPLGDFRLLAKYDLIARGADGHIQIYDWKTSRRLPQRAWLERRLQTRVYPYLLVQAGQGLNQGAPIAPDQIEMIYWFAESPSETICFPYSQARYQEDGRLLQDTVSLIQRLSADDFPLTSDERRCSFCVYRSLCDRGVQAGQWEAVTLEVEPGAELDFEIDFEQIAEIEY